MSREPDPSTASFNPATAMTSVVAALSALQVVAETATGYYAKLRAGGVPEDAAGRMTEAFHSVLIAKLHESMK